MATAMATRRGFTVLSAFIQRRGFSSALFVSDRYSKSRPVLTPTPNLAAKFQDVEKLQKNIKVRGMDADAAALKELWEFYCSLNETRSDLEKRRVQIAGEIKDLKQVGGKEADIEAEKLILEGRTVREDLKNFLQGFWEVEERMMLSCLSLPNDLHPRTPLSDHQVISQTGQLASGQNPVDHLVVGKSLIDYRGPSWYYLKNSAAIFDLALMSYFLDGMKNFGFSAMVPPDFCHAAIVEGCGTRLDDSIRLEPTEENMHLVGGSSLFPSCAYYANKALPVQCLPVRHVVGGKKYVLGKGPGLFGAWQRTSVDFLCLSSDVADLEKQVDATLEKLTGLYENLGWDYRLVYVSAPKLKPWESFRASFQMFSSSLNQVVEVGSLSLSGTFISERLSMEYEESDRRKHFCHVLSGSAVDVTLVLACLLENGTENLFPTPLVPNSFGTVTKIP